MAKKIHNFSVTGAVKDTGHLVLKQGAEERRAEETMRNAGYVPVLDITPTLETEYDPNKEVFYYTVTVFGVYVGKRQAWDYEGSLGGQLLPTTPRNKSKRSSRTSA